MLWADAGEVMKSVPAVVAIAARPTEALVLLGTVFSSLPEKREGRYGYAPFLRHGLRLPASSGVVPVKQSNGNEEDISVRLGRFST
ncbi:hypothetical protein GCM10029978_069490 [Actinoallomurus acanthiterrae]